MADTIVRLVNGETRVVVEGAELLAPLVATATDASTSAAADAVRAETAAAESAANSTAALDKLGPAPYSPASSGTIGNTTLGNATGATPGNVWFNSTPLPEEATLNTASHRIGTGVGDGTGATVFAVPTGSGTYTLRVFPVSGIAGTGVVTNDFVDFVAPAGTLVGWGSSSAGARVSYSSGTGHKYAAGGVVPADGSVVTLTAEATLAFPSQAAYTTVGYKTVESRLDSIEDTLSETTIDPASIGDTYVDTIEDVTVSTSGLTATVTGTLVRRGSRINFSNSQTLTAPATGNVRYDVHYIDLVTLGFGVVAGTASDTDAAERIPALTDSKHRALFNYRTNPTTITPVSRWNIDDGEHRALVPEWEGLRKVYRRVLRKSRARISRGATFRIAGAGDSIMALQNNAPGAAANGQYRDRPEYFTAGGRIKTDIVNALTRYTSVQLGRPDDGAGSVHVKQGFIWTGLVGALEGMGYTLGTDLFYDNWAIGGTTSADLVTSGAASAKVTSIIASGANLVVLRYGANEIGSTATEGNLRIAIKAFRDAGIDVICMGLATRPARTLEDRAKTEEAIKRACDFEGAAYVPVLPLYSDPYNGTLGLAVADMLTMDNNSTLITPNIHPGLMELRGEGRMLARLLVDDV